MKSYIFIITLICTVTLCQAQISIGPTIGSSFSFVEFENSTLNSLPITSSYKFLKKSTPAPVIGFKTEIPINNTFFISINGAYFTSANKIYDCFSRCETFYFKIDQFLVNSSVNYILPKQFGVGVGLNYLYGRYDRTYTLFGLMPNFKDIGVMFSGNYKFNQLVFELLYVQSFKSFGTQISDGTFILKPINTLQLSISYLIKNKLRFGSGNKGLDCPKF